MQFFLNIHLKQSNFFIHFKFIYNPPLKSVKVQQSNYMKFE